MTAEKMSSDNLKHCNSGSLECTEDVTNKQAISCSESNEGNISDDVVLGKISVTNKPILESLRQNTETQSSSMHSNEEINNSEMAVKDKSSYSKPTELVNELIEGPRITIPLSQLPVKDHSLQFSRSSSCSDFDEKKEIQKTEITVKHIENSTSGQVHANCNPKIHDLSIEPTSSSPELIRQNSSNASGDIKTKTKKTPNDFIFGKVIGEGSYSTVYLAKEVSTQKEFAIKVCDKKHLVRERKTHFVMREKDVLMKLDHPFFIRLAYTFQDIERLYFVLTYARNGELLKYLQKLSAFDVPCTRFYTAEIVLALEYLQSLGIIHRDLKPENILLSEDMHIKITDFGTSKILSSDENKESRRKNSFVGTAEYVSPEVLNNLPANFGSDLWALGCIIYQCLSGSLPFRSGNEYQTFQKIVKVEYDFPEGFHTDSKDLVQNLLVLEPTERIGLKGGMQAIKHHPFYAEIDWDNLPQLTPPRLMPYLPANASNPEFWGQELRAGFDDQRLAEIITGQTVDGALSPELEELPIKLLNTDEEFEKKEKLRKQREENPFHPFVQDNLIIKQGFVDKRKGLFARKRMLLLTEGPHLFYVDAHNKVLKGEIPWSKYLRPEAKNFRIFFIHTPNRTYYLESRNADAHHWVEKIKEVYCKHYGEDDK